MNADLAPIGRVAERVGLSLRTIRYYDEIGLVTPSGRTVGGFRLYSPSDVERLLLIKRMKPLGYSLEEMAELLQLVDALDAADSVGDVRARLQEYTEAVHSRITDLQTQLEYAREFHERLVNLVVQKGVPRAGDPESRGPVERA